MDTAPPEKFGPDETALEEDELIEHLRSIRRQIYERMLDQDDLDKHNRIIDFARRLKERYPDYDRHKVYHLLIGSSVEDWQDIGTDFPGEDSVARFLEQLIHEG